MFRGGPVIATVPRQRLMVTSSEHDCDRKTWAETPVRTRVLVVTAIIVVTLGLLYSLVLDGEIAFRIFLVLLLAHCGLTAILVSRRPQTLTVIDRLVIQFGIIPLFAIFMAIQVSLS